MVSPTSIRSSASCACACAFCASCVYVAAAHAVGAHVAACCSAHLCVGTNGPGLHVREPGVGCTPPGSSQAQLSKAGWSCHGLKQVLRYAGDSRRQLPGCCGACASQAAAAKPSCFNAWGCRERSTPVDACAAWLAPPLQRRQGCAAAAVWPSAPAGAAGAPASVRGGSLEGSCSAAAGLCHDVQPCMVMIVRHA